MKERRDVSEPMHEIKLNASRQTTHKTWTRRTSMFPGLSLAGFHQNLFF